MSLPAKLKFIHKHFTPSLKNNVFEIFKLFNHVISVHYQSAQKAEVKESAKQNYLIFCVEMSTKRN